jgi:minor extracellular serine protease Vpr
VLSSIPHQFCKAPPCFAFFQGTSMATPHLAGSAAVVKWLHPTWDAWQIRSAIVNTADEGVLKKASSGALETDVNIIGSGLDDLFNAVNAIAAIDPVSVSFGAVPSGSGTSASYEVHITNLQASAYTFSLSVDAGGGGVHYSLSASTIHLNAGETGSFWVLMTTDKGATLGDHSADLDISGTAGYLHAVVYTFIK